MIWSDTLRNRRGEVAFPVTVALEDRINTLLTKDPNKLLVYTGFTRYVVNINGSDHTILENTIVEYDGIKMTGKELYEKLQNC